MFTATRVKWTPAARPLRSVVVGCLIPLQATKPPAVVFCLLWRDAIPIYISRGRFTADAVKGMLAKPEIVAKLFKSLE
jgi:hypothetical protein